MSPLRNKYVTFARYRGGTPAPFAPLSAKLAFLRQTRFTALSCAADPELSDKIQQQWCPVLENLAETFCFRLQRGYILLLSRLLAAIEVGFCLAVRPQVQRAVSAFTADLFVLLLRGCVCRCRPLSHNQWKVTKSEQNVFVSHWKQTENRIIFKWKVAVYWRCTSI